ncbi:hypothetical protein Vadar_030943 [Vaccinium darrowii]|uniref:Uncharacterized protein n=1 Tax=Vaccinium darrowii TaxID=229202 RepID=A0ACB7Z876_9ERIC|nr:hypothetical protein Vadar_030943 [Vaccinium darrowii]
MIVPLDQKMDMLWSFIKSHLNSKILVFLSSCKQFLFNRQLIGLFRWTVQKMLQLTYKVGRTARYLSGGKSGFIPDALRNEDAQKITRRYPSSLSRCV